MMKIASNVPETLNPPCAERGRLIAALYYYRATLLDAESDALAVYFIEMTIAELTAPAGGHLS